MDDQIRRRIIGNYEWITQFNVNDYLYNQPMIEKLFEERQMALTESVELRERVRQLEQQTHNLEIENERLRARVGEIGRNAVLIVAFSFGAALLAGVGGNLIASDPRNGFGWFLIGLAVLVQIAIWYITPKRGN